MANRWKPPDPNRTFKLDKPTWNEFKTNANRMGSDASKELQQFCRWFNREPGVGMPQRPPVRQASA